jgi:CubicO group peptidase (beta-lactamase class C family)
MLVDEGRVQWDAPVIRYLPHFRVADPYVTRELTVRDLLTHRGGLGNADQLWTAVDYSTEEIVRRTATIEPAYSFRSGFIYQTILYAVAGEVVAAASGMPWAEFLQARIFDPLGMRDTEARLADLAGQANVAAPHDIVGDSVRVVANRSVDAVAAAGSVWSSIRDMAAWTRFVLDSARVDGRRLLSAQSYAQIMSPQVIAPLGMYPTTALSQPRFFTYGLGWFIHDYAGAAVAMHTGSIDGMSALVGLLPDRPVGIYVLANLDHAELRHALMYRLFDLAAGRAPRDWSTDLIALYGSISARADSARLAQERRRAADTRPALPLERYAGTYENPTYGRAVVSLRDGALHFAFGRRMGPLEHWEYDTFRARWQDERMSSSLVTFSTDGAGGTSSVRAFGVTFTRIRSP